MSIPSKTYTPRPPGYKPPHADPHQQQAANALGRLYADYVDSRTAEDDREPEETTEPRRAANSIVSNRVGRVETFEGCEPSPLYESADRFTAEHLERLFVAQVMGKGEAIDRLQAFRDWKPERHFGLLRCHGMHYTYTSEMVTTEADKSVTLDREDAMERDATQDRKQAEGYGWDS